MIQLRLEAEGQVRYVAEAIAEVGRPGASLREITAKVLMYNAELELCYKTDTLPNSVRRAIYEHLGDDHDGVFVRDGRGYYRLSIKVVVGSVVHGDAWDVVKLLPERCVDLVLTDPPWTALGTFCAMGTNPRMMRKTFAMKDIDDVLVMEFARVLKDERHAYLFFPALNEVTVGLFCHIMTLVKEAGLKLEKVLVWDKVGYGMGYRYRYQHELIMFLSKGKMRKLNDLGIGDVLAFPRVPNAVHPTQKPVALLRTLVEQSTQPQEIVLDTFAGSGSTGVACVEAGRQFILVDVDLEWVSVARDAVDGKIVSLCS